MRLESFSNILRIEQPKTILVVAIALRTHGHSMVGMVDAIGRPFSLSIIIARICFQKKGVRLNFF